MSEFKRICLVVWVWSEFGFDIPTCLADLFFVILTLNKRKYLKFCHTKYDNTKSVLEVVDESAYGLIKFDSIHKKAKWIAKNFDITLKEIENDKAYKMRQKGE